MKIVLYILTGLISFTFFYNAVRIVRTGRNDNWTSQNNEIVQTPSITPFPTLVTELPTITPIPTVKPSIPIPSPTIVLQPSIKPEIIHGFIERFAGQYAVDPNVLRHIATCESGFRPEAINGNYAGLFQFSSNTWIKYRQLMGEDTDTTLRTNAEEAVQTGAYVLSIGRGDIWPNCNP
ncbi:transglycosylase SLT domain-containing protein [Candidatus Woesebacteria bacterium]|nr:MAG: transglycosylase SLT domain-containing protein [Candidatus Woesebacteria bacterium]